MRLTLFGSTGRTGRLLVSLAIERGHEVITLVRSPTRLVKAGDGLYYIQGDVMDEHDVSRAVAGSDAVISMLGHTATSSADILTVGTRHIVAGMKAHGVQRLVTLSCASIADAGDRPGISARIAQLAVRQVLRPDLKDSSRAHRLLLESDLQWTVVRALLISDRPSDRPIRAGYLGKDTGERVSRPDLARFLLDCAVDATFIHECPAVSN